jgi:hypothetical protein
MGKASYICAVCSQDFTRKWSGKRHNQDLHFGMAEIVRVLDYIIGRLSGKYFQADPGKENTVVISKDEEILFREEVPADLRVISLDTKKIGIVYPNLLNTTEDLI